MTVRAGADIADIAAVSIRPELRVHNNAVVAAAPSRHIANAAR